MMPPLVMKVRIEEAGRRRLRLWLPLFVLWLLLLVLAVPLLALMLAADLALALTGRRAVVTSAAFGVLRLLGALRGLRVDVAGAGSGNRVQVACW